MTFLKCALAASLFPSFAWAADLACTAKRLDQANSEYAEQALKVDIDHDTTFVASTTVNDCYFSVQTHDSITYQVAILQKTEEAFVSTYSSLDPKGNLILSYSKNKGNFVCMLVCAKPAQK